MSRDEAFKLGMSAEKEPNTANAIFIYRSLIRQHPAYEPAYARLMTLFRKAKEYGNEIEIIDQAIEVALASYAKTSRIKVNPQITKLSAMLAKSTGLHDKKGKPLHEPEIVTRWRKRRSVAATRLAKSNITASGKQKPPRKKADR